MKIKIDLCKENNIMLIEIYDKDIVSDNYKKKLIPFIK